MISYSDLTLGENTVSTHTCEAGSALTTDLSTRTCRMDGDWSGSPLVCAGMGPPNTYSINHSHYLTGSACPDLTDLQNGVISYNTVSANSYRRVTTVATYSCDTGFDLTGGTSMRTCNAGAWDGSEPTCIGKSVYYCGNRCYCIFPPATTPATCTDLTPPTNGMISYDMGTIVARPLNTVATFTCITGYILSMTGDMTRTCGATGMWSGSAPTCECESIQCGYNIILLFCCSALSRPPCTNQWSSDVQSPHHPQSCGLHGYLHLSHWIPDNWTDSEDVYCQWMEHWR